MIKFNLISVGNEEVQFCPCASVNEQNNRSRQGGVYVRKTDTLKRDI